MKIYGKGISYRPAIDGKQDTPHNKEIYLEQLLPLEDYDMIIVLFSGGKDSLACVLRLLEMGVPKEKIELWHHDIDGGEPNLHMDWLPTQNYCRAVAEYLGIRLRVSWRIGGFWSEVYRIGASNSPATVFPSTKPSFAKLMPFTRTSEKYFAMPISPMTTAAEISKCLPQTKQTIPMIVISAVRAA